MISKERLYEPIRLELIATKLRKDILKSIYTSSSGHPGGSLSCIDILTALYFGRIINHNENKMEFVMRYDSEDPLWKERDKVVLSKGHAAPALYAVLSNAGFFGNEWVNELRKTGSLFQGHPEMYRRIDGGYEGVPGIEASTGSLGHGLPFAAGLAYDAKLECRDSDVYVIVGDGEAQEGSIWEALMFIGNRKLNNMCVFFDYNRLQIDGPVDEINSIDPLADKLRAFNFRVDEVNGHDFKDILDSLYLFKRTKQIRDKPLAVIANTIKGKGVKSRENDYKFHGSPPGEKEFKDAMKCLDSHLLHLISRLGNYYPLFSKPLEDHLKLNCQSMKETKARR